MLMQRQINAGVAAEHPDVGFLRRTDEALRIASRGAGAVVTLTHLQPSRAAPIHKN